MGWIKDPPKLSEIMLGNLFHVDACRRVVITGVHISGKIEVADALSKKIETFDNVKKLQPIDLPEGANCSLLTDYLKNTEFKEFTSGHYIMRYEDGKINLAHQMIKERWVIWYSGNDDTEILVPIHYLHEFQNAFTLITKAKLSLI